ncbi:hypothetical protein [Aliivibrio fischeri]|uniref:hypothetical protein n=1 Tax=Aliivibrio fischeri TaxID=668 RepID=UPI00080E8E1C|nr:hypothetical protein [Aliivibrio fischeri]OCH05002.1 hypothetical protein A6E11_18760 [Aliivibrio fischeri]
MKLKLYREWHQKSEFSSLFFFAQRLDEIFFDYTLDTYKPPALNSIFLCREAIKLISDIEDELIDAANLSHVLDELEWSLSLDPIVKQMLTAPTNYFILRGESVKLSDTKVRLEVLERTLNPLYYLDICETLLLESIENGSKKQIELISRCYASTLINMGVSKQHLYEQTQRFFFNGSEILDLEELKDFFYSISVTSHHYEIYFIVSDLIKEVMDSIPVFGLKIVDELPQDVLDVAKVNGILPTQKEVWVEVKDIEIYDRHAARIKAEKKLDMVRDLFLLFSHKNRITWRGESIITQCCDETPILIRKPKNSMEKCSDLRPKDASNRLNSMIVNMGLEGHAFNKFHRVVDLHAISTTNDLPENQLLNVWIALETLVPSQVNGGGKMVKVSNGIMPILLRRYLPRLIERLAADLIRWDRKKTSKLLRDINEPSEKGLYQKVLELIVLPANKALLTSLYSELGHFHLLRFRVFELVELFKKPENLLKRISLHEKKVSWQLRRIYRTRNLIVHSGGSISYIETLIENAHDYLDQTMDSVLDYTCGVLDATTLEQVFDMAKIDYDVYLKELRNIKQFDSDNIWLIL